MTKAPDLLVVVPRQHVGEMRDPEAHLGAERGGQQLAGDVSDVSRRWRLKTVVAIATTLRRLFAEVAKQYGSAAFGCLDQCGKRIQALALAGAPIGLDFGFDPPPGAREVFRRPE